jgi:hypothetical protein
MSRGPGLRGGQNDRSDLNRAFRRYQPALSQKLQLFASRGADRQGLPGRGPSRAGAANFYPFDRDGPGRPVRVRQSDAAIAFAADDYADGPTAGQLPAEADPLTGGDPE